MSTLAYRLDVSPATATDRDRRAVRIWLYAVAAILVALVLVGGATRLTESGLSITEWKPIHGVIPPLSAAEWQEEFDLYKRIPQYREMNQGMTLSGFKAIYWWEWSHRLLARGVGFVFALPLAVFWLSGRLEPFLKPRLVGLLCLGGFQGAVGWWMVASGLVHRTEVSQYRLATHLTIACLIFTATLWIARGLVSRPASSAAPKGLRRLGVAVVALALFQIYLGGLVAGLRAGYIYNTWPLMEGALIPHGLLAMEPLWRNFFENYLTVQFAHRCGAYLLFTATFVQAIVTWRKAPGTRFSHGALLLFLLVCGQAAIGITTLLLVVPIDWALLHQAGGLAVLATAVVHARGLAGSYLEKTVVEPT
ncbi:COX15/CtaA family protein [Jiella sp. MQZ9-1]|uniref:Heme A synthase n=1 Tax=Jiella flava TaxID=2816857 RepID=A0A939JWQ6_9HYPH|nr:COX15/CtaA family protein [Jiella flava]MBO0663769.1 COX15/CtaA family protein [Jiella flava]MCD2472342.1 COX15/CtaA family protein [Jiella flava]